MDKKITVYALTHKKFTPPGDRLYVPLQVGGAVQEDLGYLRDDAGENISARNCYYSELTGLYWIWKNVKDLDYVGTCHYRRYLINGDGRIFTADEYKTLLERYDLITTKRVHLNNSYHFGFAANHNIVALDVTGEVIRELYPEYYETFLTLVNGAETYFGNMLVTKKPLFDEYCEWLFSIFFEVEKRIDMETDEDAYHRRVFGFISEFLLYVWVTVRGLLAFECKVGMLGEKAETREIKMRLAEYLKAHDIDGAKAYFLEQHKNRPDILMEASDVTGELRLAMQMIATAGEELRRCGRSILDTEDDFFALVPIFAGLNRAVTAAAEKDMESKELLNLKNSLISEAAIEVAVAIYPNEAVNKEELLQWLIRQQL